MELHRLIHFDTTLVLPYIYRRVSLWGQEGNEGGGDRCGGGTCSA